VLVYKTHKHMLITPPQTKARLSELIKLMRTM
jgi:hypothetical protein